jgi:hypothetical protein
MGATLTFLSKLCIGQGNSSDSESAIHQGFCGIHSEISARKAKARRKTRMTQQVTTLATVQQQ